METQVHNPEQEIDQSNYPPLAKRFLSLITDQVFLILCMVLFSMLLSDTDAKETAGLRAALLIGLFFIYEPFCMAFGCTLGNYIAGIRVRKFSDDEKHISLFQAYLRFALKIMLGIISLFTVTGNKHKRAIHDMGSGSVMVYVKK